MWRERDWAAYWLFSSLLVDVLFLFLHTCDLQREMEANPSSLPERATERLHLWAACRGVVGWGGMGSRWRWFRPISTTEGGTEDGHGPPSPINGIQGDALSSHQHHPFLTPNPSPPTHTTSSSSLTPNHTILDVESIIWILAVLEMRPDSHQI